MKFLVAVDGSKQSDAALDYARRIAEATDASLTVVHAVTPQVYAEGGDAPIESLSEAESRLITEAVSDAESRAQTLVDEAVARLDDAPVPVEGELLYGDPIVVVPEYADAGGFDGIFVGHRGLSRRYEGLLGSVAKALVERSTVPVTVVR